MRAEVEALGLIFARRIASMAELAVELLLFGDVDDARWPSASGVCRPPARYLALRRFASRLVDDVDGVCARVVRIPLADEDPN